MSKSHVSKTKRGSPACRGSLAALLGKPGGCVRHKPGFSECGRQKGRPALLQGAGKGLRLGARRRKEASGPPGPGGPFPVRRAGRRPLRFGRRACSARTRGARQPAYGKGGTARECLRQGKGRAPGRDGPVRAPEGPAGPGAVPCARAGKRGKKGKGISLFPSPGVPGAFAGDADGARAAGVRDETGCAGMRGRGKEGARCCGRGLLGEPVRRRAGMGRHGAFSFAGAFEVRGGTFGGPFSTQKTEKSPQSFGGRSFGGCRPGSVRRVPWCGQAPPGAAGRQASSGARACRKAPGLRRGVAGAGCREVRTRCRRPGFAGRPPRCRPRGRWSGGCRQRGARPPRWRRGQSLPRAPRGGC